MVEFLRFRRENRAALFGVIADGDDKIKIDASVFADIVRGVVRNVDAVGLHGGDRARVQAMRFDAGAVDFGFALRKVIEIAMRDLAAAAVAGAEDEDFLHVGGCE